MSTIFLLRKIHFAQLSQNHYARKKRGGGRGKREEGEQCMVKTLNKKRWSECQTTENLNCRIAIYNTQCHQRKGGGGEGRERAVCIISTFFQSFKRLNY